MIMIIEPANRDTIFEKCLKAREAIVAELKRRYEAKDTGVCFITGASFKSPYCGSGTIEPCPICGKGLLAYSRASCNGHVWARCSTENCVRWME